jgi:hypothetical protein
VRGEGRRNNLLLANYLGNQFLCQGDESAYSGHLQQSLRLVLLSMLASAPAAGCIPWVSVPARVELAPMQALVTRDPDGPAGSDAARGMRFRAAICPLVGATKVPFGDWGFWGARRVC